MNHRPTAKARTRGTRTTSQRGQSLMEYVVVCGALAVALGLGMADESSALGQLLQAFRTGYERLSFSLSVPM